MTLKESEKHLQHELERIKELLKIEQQNHRETLAKVFWIVTRLAFPLFAESKRKESTWPIKRGKTLQRANENSCHADFMKRGKMRVNSCSWLFERVAEVFKSNHRKPIKKDHNQWITCVVQRGCPIKGFRWLCVQFTLILLKCFRGVNQFRCIDFD